MTALTDSIEFLRGDFADARVRTRDNRYFAVQPGLARTLAAEHDRCTSRIRVSTPLFLSNKKHGEQS